MQLVHLLEHEDFVHALEQEKISMMVELAVFTYDDVEGIKEQGKPLIQKLSPYNFGEIVGVAASYSDSGYSMDWVIENIEPSEPMSSTLSVEASYPGWTNSYCVVPQAMNNMIVIDDIRLCRLSEIPINDFKKMGVYQEKYFDPKYNIHGYRFKIYGINYETYKLYDAFWRLLQEKFCLDEEGMRDMWKYDPYVFVYKFHLLDEEKTENIYQAWLQSIHDK